MSDFYLQLKEDSKLIRKGIRKERMRVIEIIDNKIKELMELRKELDASVSHQEINSQEKPGSNFMGGKLGNDDYNSSIPDTRTGLNVNVSKGDN